MLVPAILTGYQGNDRLLKVWPATEWLHAMYGRAQAWLQPLDQNVLFTHKSRGSSLASKWCNNSPWLSNSLKQAICMLRNSKQSFFAVVARSSLEHSEVSQEKVISNQQLDGKCADNELEKKTCWNIIILHVSIIIATPVWPYESAEHLDLICWGEC